MRRGTAVAVTVAGVFLAGVAIHSAFDHRGSQKTPFLVALPSAAPARCAAAGPPDKPGADRVWVDPSPTGGVVIWRPGSGRKPCRPVMTRIGAAQAKAVADRVEHGTGSTAPNYTCPASDGSSAQVYLTYAGSAQAQYVEEYLSGCGGVVAPGRLLLPISIVDLLGKQPAGLH